MATNDLTTEGQLSALSAAVKADVADKAGTTHAANHATGGADPLTPSQIGAATAGLAGLPAASTIAFVWHTASSTWRSDYNGAAVTARPTARADIRAVFYGGTAAPAWAIAGDIHAPEA